MIQIDKPMPKSCVECFISRTPKHWEYEYELECPFVDLFVTELDERPKECPLKEIKENNNVSISKH